MWIYATKSMSQCVCVGGGVDGGGYAGRCGGGWGFYYSLVS